MAASAVTAEEGERRLLTVLFCDLVDATRLSEELDAEDWRRVLRSYHAACGEVVRELEGHVAQYLGDGLLVYFGYPLAFEDSPRRAVQAGLRMHEVVAALGERHRSELGITLAARVGIHSGSVVIDDVGDRQDRLAVGDVPNVASRVQAAATPGTLLITEATYRLVRGYYECKSLGAQSFKGVSEPMKVYQVVRDSGASSRLEAAAPADVHRLVGRVEEQAQLAAAWERALAGSGPTLLLLGEPGIGKSRHVSVLKQRLAGQPHAVIECRSSAYHQSTLLYPLVEHLERRLGAVRERSAASIRRDLAAELRPLGDLPPEQLKLITSLMTLPMDREPDPEPMPPQQRRQATFQLLLSWIQGTARSRPTLFIVEDLHWADPSTLELLGLLIGQPAQGQLLVLLTARPEFRPPWPASDRVQSVTISRLARKETADLLAQMTRGRVLPEVVVRQVTEKADGVPLFIEEITKAVLESGVLQETDDGYHLEGVLTADSIPATIQDSLNARLDRLNTGKRLAQLAAVLGREFSYELLRAVVALPDDDLARDLRLLVDAQLLVQEGEGPRASFSFRHALIQDAAYQSMLRSTRHRFHRQIATTIKDQFAELAASRPEVLAHHYTGAKLPHEAAAQWHAAGQRAIAGSAHAEAIGHFERGLEQVAAQPASPERARQELDLRTGLGLAFLTTKGFAAREVEECYGRAAQLCDELGDAIPLRVLYGIWVVNVVRSDPAAVGLLVPRLERVVDQATDRASRLIALACLGVHAFWQGRYDRVVEIHGEALSLVDTDDPKRQHEALMRDFGFEGQLTPQLYLAWAQAFTGQPDAARRSWEQAWALAEKTGDSYVQTMAQSFGAALHRDLGDLPAAGRLAERARATSVEKGFHFWLAVSSVVSGRSLFETDAEAGLARMNEGLGLFRAIGARLPYPYYLSYLAEACLKLGRLEAAAAAIDEALPMARANVDRNYLPQLLRLQEEILLARERRARGR